MLNGHIKIDVIDMKQNFDYYILYTASSLRTKTEKLKAHFLLKKVSYTKLLLCAIFIHNFIYI